MDSVKNICDMLDIAYDAVADIPKITVLGEREIYVENFVSLEEYKNSNIKLKCKKNVIVIEGEGFVIKGIKEGCIFIDGRITNLKFI